MSRQLQKGNITVAYTDLSSNDKPEDWFYGGKSVVSLFTRRLKPCSWYTQITVNDANKGSSELPIFDFSKTADFARGGWAESTFPKVSVKAADNGRLKYRIALTWNAAHHVWPSVALKFNDLQIAAFDSVALDMVSQYRVSAAKWALYQKFIGNTPELQEWTDVLPKTVLKLPSPFYYAQDASQSLPICLATLNNMKEEYVAQTDLRNLIRVQINEAPLDQLPEWRDAKAGEVDFSSILEVDGGKALEMSDTRHWTKYILITDDERESHEKEVRDVIIEQVQNTNAKKGGVGEHRHDFRFGGPVKALFFGMINKTSDEYNNRSNYSDDTRSGAKGSDPIAKISYSYDNDERFENVDGSWFDMETWYHGERSISEVGYHGIFYNQHINHIDVTGSSNFSNLVTSFDLEVEETSGQDNKYTFAARALTMHRLRFKELGGGFPRF
jgi:hypothetical protein